MANAPAPAVDPLAPFARRSTKHEWIESTLTALEDQINANASLFSNNAISSSTPAGGQQQQTSNPNASQSNSKTATGNNNKPGTANSQQGKRSSNKDNNKDNNNADGSTLSPEQLAYAAYQPIKRHVTNAALVSLYNDKRLLMFGGSVGGESTTQVAEFDVA